MGQEFLFYSNILIWIVLIFILFTLFVLFRQFGTVYLAKSDAIERDGISIGASVPNIEGVSYFSNNLITGQSFKGKPTLLAFVSPGCTPCRELITEWNKAYLRYKDNINFVLIGIGDKDSFSKVKVFSSVKSEMILDPEKNILQACRVRVTPFAFILNSEGEVKGKGLCNGLDHIKGLMSSLESDSEFVEPILEGALK